MSSWTVDMDEQLKSMWLDGMSAQEIAAKIVGAFRPSRNAVIGRKNRIIKSKKRKTEPKHSRAASKARSTSSSVKNHFPPKPKTFVALLIEEPRNYPRKTTLLDLNDDQCRHILPDLVDGQTMYCGESGFPFCPYHRNKFTTLGKARR
jgi:hypothetical protein